ncbi:MAG TPA: tRNA (adenosine(37)-N6)-threonylcarbamoyltransferase complex dimerization subunit type 1 TsaB [Bacteroidales bacterium]|nr:tRNA (adenosine(37)-N6)-threonylcarbamoyltransferase complex dimerization subunit type 1 TsaB [Bacteroidales bacterium]
MSAIILCIETSTIACSVALAKDGEVASLKEDLTGKIHPTLLLPFIDEILKKEKLNIKQIDAIAISKGPGSYTGLRVGVSTAKGLCYAIDKPLLAIDTLQAMAVGMQQIVKNSINHNDLFVPLIDARRMEVYSSVYNTNNEQIREILAEVIDENSFSEFLKYTRVFFAGDALSKCKEVLHKKTNAIFIDNFLPSAKWLCPVAYKLYENKEFANLAYFEPFYLKDFIAKKSKVKGLM